MSPGQPHVLQHMRDCLRTLSVPTAFVYGAIAGIGVYLVMILFLAIELAVLGDGESTGIALVEFLYGTVGDFYASHLGTTQEYTPGIKGVEAVPALAYYLTPVFFLMGAGRRSATVAPGVGDPDRYITGLDDTIQGSAIVLGYAAISLFLVVGMLSLGSAISTSIISLRPVLIVGLVYPLVFGAIGGFTTRFQLLRPLV